MLRASLLDADPAVSLAALRWIADHRIKRHRFLVKGISEDPRLSVDVFLATLTALDRIDRPDEAAFTEERLKEILMELVRNEQADIGLRQLALKVVPGIRSVVPADLVLKLLKLAEGEQRVWITHFLGQLSGEEKLSMLRGLAFDDGEDPEVRAAALTHMTMTDEDLPQLLKMVESGSGPIRGAILSGLQGLRLSFEQQGRLRKLQGEENQMAVKRVLGEPFVPVKRPSTASVSAWKTYLARLEGDPDVNQGRMVFFSSARGGCAECHQIEGLGNAEGLPLLKDDQVVEAEFVLSSLLAPSQRVGVRGTGWKIETCVGTSHLVFQLDGQGEKRRYMDMKRRLYDWSDEEVLSRENVSVSVMPDDLVQSMTDAEVRDLVAYLNSIFANN
jgi:putative heme-binding domain-containing protein